MRSLLAIGLSALLAGVASAEQVQFPRDCAALLAKEVPGWRTAAPERDVLAWAKGKNLNPVVTRGDFDGNKTHDWATIGFVDGRSKLAFCFAKPGGKRVVVTEDGGCSDWVYTLKRGTKIPNLDSGTEEVLQLDTVATSCFEKSGRAFLLEGNTFRVFFHSD